MNRVLLAFLVGMFLSFAAQADELGTGNNVTTQSSSAMSAPTADDELGTGMQSTDSASYWELLKAWFGFDS